MLFFWLVPWWIWVPYLVLWLYVMVTLVLEDREPGDTLAWAFALLLLPVVGIIFYFFAGRDWAAIDAKKGRLRAYLDAAREALGPFFARTEPARERFERLYAGTFIDRLRTAIRRENGFRIVTADTAEIFETGLGKFEHLKRDLSAAQRFIHIQYFIWENDELTDALIDILRERAQAGVEVRFLYDYVGSIAWRKKKLQALVPLGVQVAVDMARSPGSTTATIARSSSSMARSATPAATTWVRSTWTAASASRAGATRISASPGRSSASSRHCSPFAGRSTARRTCSARSTCRRRPAARRKAFSARWWRSRLRIPGSPRARVHMVAVGNAERRVWIQSPYFVPEVGLYDTMINAALTGVDVRFMMTGVPDKPVPFWAAWTYFRPLLQAGAHIYLYKAGFLHSKTIAVDSQVAAIGTMNMDIRSLRLHKELMVWLFDERLARQQEALFETDIAECHEVTLAELAALSLPVRCRNSFMRLLSYFI
jgi:cardiolipin synthase